MKRQDPAGVGMPARVGMIVAALAAMAALILALDSAAASRDREAATAATAVALRPVAGEPIASEADVFRTRPGMLAADTGARRRTGAHPRTLATYRALRAYPGAPPRIPHGLDTDEFRATGCNTCHERGGYSPRFNAYTPVTPHPELEDCLQCHAGDAAIVGVTFLDSDPDAACRQCHTPSAMVAPRVALDWRPAAWPELTQPVPGGGPSVIPHDLQLRGNCLACHMGPAAVAGMRTTHPERANCRQCHVPAASDELEFVRPRGGG